MLLRKTLAAWTLHTSRLKEQANGTEPRITAQDRQRYADTPHSYEHRRFPPFSLDRQHFTAPAAVSFSEHSITLPALPAS
jgi:hypothetical protein